jgi:peptidoglycan hydrolase CwlO-like protein
MKKVTILLLILLLISPNAILFAEQKPLKQEQVLKLSNYELSLQNLQLQIEVLNREIQRLEQERNSYVDELYKKYGLDKKWKIDLERGIWFIEEASAAENTQGN